MELNSLEIVVQLVLWEREPFALGAWVKNNTVSVVIAFHNGSRWIERALNSVKSQTVPCDEIVVVDDGSSTSESDFLRSMAKDFDFRLVHQDNAGQSAARNRGVQESVSDFICLLDQDDYFLPNHIEHLLSIAQIADPKFAYSYGDLHRIDEAGDLLSTSSINIEATHPHKDVETMIATNMHILPSATLIRRSAFLDIGGFDPELRGYEDDDLFLRFRLAGYSSTFTADPVSAWTRNLNSTSFSEAMSSSRYVYLQKLLEKFPEGSLDDVNVFADLLHPRLGINIADDVIGSALGVSGSHQQRVARLRVYLSLVLKNKKLQLQKKLGYALIALPLILLPKSVIAFFLKLLLRSGVIGQNRGPKLLRGFAKKYSV
jgi:glycosyltransferase involved in cell wall biosynthesis